MCERRGVNDLSYKTTRRGKAIALMPPSSLRFLRPATPTRSTLRHAPVVLLYQDAERQRVLGRPRRLRAPLLRQRIRQPGPFPQHADLYGCTGVLVEAPRHTCRPRLVLSAPRGPITQLHRPHHIISYHTHGQCALTSSLSGDALKSPHRITEPLSPSRRQCAISSSICRRRYCRAPCMFVGGESE